MDGLSIDGAWLYTPRIFSDSRGAFLECFRANDLVAGAGQRFDLAQVNCSISRRGVLRGVHFADVPPGQAKYIMCVSGAILDVIVDLRVGSSTFGQWETVELDDVSRSGLFLAEGLGHGFQALTDNAAVVYLCSQPYAPGREHGVHPLDPDLAIEWRTDVEPIMSEKDAEAPSLKQALDSGLLPDYATCLAHYATLAPNVG